MILKSEIDGSQQQHSNSNFYTERKMSNQEMNPFSIKATFRTKKPLTAHRKPSN